MKQVRCAIYTRKSSDEGLEQDFNSLDAQREACAAYILSQASEGWQLLPGRYDDGGISGGTLERPALQRLLADVAAGLIDIIVIYKIDRLTRSLLDFAKLVEAFEKAGTSFVSVTQSFNTTNSMGRLTLNMLLSFAQFEREVTAERIRDKLAASKAKGMWMGGIPPLGYRPDGRSLAIIEKHAAIIRDIYARYRKLGNVRLVAGQLAGEGIRTPPRRSATGRAFGGRPFSRGQLYAILRNPVYAGDIAHHGKVSHGNHPPIIAREEWDAVQAKLAAHVRGERGARTATRSPLAGLIRDGAGQPLLASHTRKDKQRYRYYVSKALHLGDGGAGTGMRIPAGEIEQAVAGALARAFADPLHLGERAGLMVAPSALDRLVSRCGELEQRFGERGLDGGVAILDHVTVHDSGLVIHLATKALSEALGLPAAPHAMASVAIPVELRLTRTGRAVRLIQGNGAPVTASAPDPALVQLVSRAQQWWTMIREQNIGPADLARREGVTVSYVTRVLRVAFLAPQVVEAILRGEQRAALTVTMLLRHNAIPDRWDEQKARFLAG